MGRIRRRDRSGQRYSTSSDSDSGSYGRRARSRSRGRHRSGSRSHGRRRSRRRSRERNRSGSSGKDDSRGKHDKRSSRRGRSRERSKTSPEKSRDAMKGIETVKQRMRLALENAQSEMENIAEGKSSSSETRTVVNLTVTETVARHRDIERIKEDGFQQSTFISSAGGAGGRVRKEDVTDRKQEEHDKAMFGPKWQDAERKQDDEKQETVADDEMHKETPLANARFSEDPAIREERWLKIYRERRAKLLCL